MHIVTAMLQIDFCGEGKNKTLEGGLYANISFNAVLAKNHFQSQTIHLLVVITCFLCYCSPISKETQVNKRHCDAKRRKASVWTRQQLVGFLSGEVCPAQEQFTLLIDTDASSKRKMMEGEIDFNHDLFYTSFNIFIFRSFSRMQASQLHVKRTT